jgi:hypothetical protein
MAKKSNAPPVEIVSDRPHAPLIYFENTPTLGYANGVIRLTLTARLTLPRSDLKVANEEVAVCYLRCNLPAARGLRKAIDDALLLAAPVQTNPYGAT